MSLINSLETKLGRFAIPGVVNILAGFQVVVWVMLLLQPEFERFLVLDRGRVLAGEVWRVITWALIPSSRSLIGVFFLVYVMFLIGRGLEEAWGAFRLNLYLFGGIAFVVFGALVFGANPVGLALYTTLFFAFAMFYPNHEFMVFLIIPVKVKYLAMLSGAYWLLNFIGIPEARLSIGFAVMNFLVAFGPSVIKGMSQRAETGQRRAKFESAKIAEGEHFHQCKSCGKTEVTDPRLEFRVAGDDEEYCVVCLAKKTAG